LPQPTNGDDARNAPRLIGRHPHHRFADRPGSDHNVMIVSGGQSGGTFAGKPAR
jgi:hypothetical protein